LKKVNVAVIGCGSWGGNHALVYKNLQRAALLAVADVNQSVAKEIGIMYNVDWYTNLDAVFNRSDIEAVSVCTPTVTLADIALTAIKAGKHVLVEKPMTDTIDEAKSLIRAAKAQGVYLAVGFVERFNPAVNETIKKNIGRGDRRCHTGTREEGQ